MAKSSNKPLDDERQGRPDMREKSSAGDLVEGELTASQRRIWEERAASFDEHSDPGERSRREAARQKRVGKATPERTEQDPSPPR